MADYSVTTFEAQLADREAIRLCLTRYSRSVDRLDAESTAAWRRPMGEIPTAT